MTAKTMIVRFPVVVCILLTLYVAEGRASERFRASRKMRPSSRLLSNLAALRFGK